MENRYFYCYSNHLKNYFIENNLRYISKSIHFKTKKVFWIFEGTEQLNSLLKKWKSNK